MLSAIALVLKARQQQDEDEARAASLALGHQTEASQQPPATEVDESPTPVSPAGKRGRRLDPDGRDAGNDTGMGTATQEVPDVPP